MISRWDEIGCRRGQKKKNRLCCNLNAIHWGGCAAEWNTTEFSCTSNGRICSGLVALACTDVRTIKCFWQTLTFLRHPLWLFLSVRKLIRLCREEIGESHVSHVVQLCLAQSQRDDCLIALHSNSGTVTWKCYWESAICYVTKGHISSPDDSSVIRNHRACPSRSACWKTMKYENVWRLKIATQRKPSG